MVVVHSSCVPAESEPDLGTLKRDVLSVRASFHDPTISSPFILIYMPLDFGFGFSYLAFTEYAQ